MPTSVHPSAQVGPGVELDDGVVIGPGAVVLGPAWLHEGVRVGAGAVIGVPPELTSAPQNAAWNGDLQHHGVEIGARTVVRELSTVHQGSLDRTRIGSDCWLLNRCYVAHDSQVGNGVTLSAGVSLGGHVRIDDRANLGMGALVHQRRVVGQGAMVGMGSAVTRDVPPYALAHGVPVRLHGVNAVGLLRGGVGQADVDLLAAAYAGEQVDERSLPPALSAAWRAWWSSAPTKPLLRGTTVN